MDENLSVAGRWRRALRHFTSTSASGRQAFPDASLKAIEAAIGNGERLHRAEVRLIIEAALQVGSVLSGVNNRQRALALFAQYGIWDTEDNCGVLIYVNLADRQVEIVADRNVTRSVTAQQWQAICQSMAASFATGAYGDGALAAIDTLNQLLHQHFPAQGTHANQLPDRPVIL